MSIKIITSTFVVAVVILGAGVFAGKASIPEIDLMNYSDKSPISGSYTLNLDFINGLASVRASGEEFHILPNGMPAYEERYYWVGSFWGEGLAAVYSGPQTEPGNGFHIGTNGKPAYAERYDAVYLFHNGVAHVVKDGEHFHILPSGKPAYDERYEWIDKITDQTPEQTSVAAFKGGQCLEINKNTGDVVNVLELEVCPDWLTK